MKIETDTINATTTNMPHLLHMLQSGMLHLHACVGLDMCSELFSFLPVKMPKAK